MKKLYYSILAAVLLFAGQSNFAQQKDNPWSLEAGVNYVNVYSVGEDAPQGEFFDEFFNINDHWNVGTYFAVTRDFGKWVSLTARGSFNNITKWGENANNERVFVDNLTYYGMDGMVNVKFLADTKIKPYVTLGGGYTWIEEGT